MRVLFDHQIFVNQKAGGISRYITDLKNGLNLIPGMDCRIVAHFSDNLYLKQGKTLAKLPFFKRASRFVNTSVIKAGYSNAADIIHPTYYNIKYLSGVKKPVILTVHDLIYFKYPQYFKDFEKFKNQFSYAIKRCDGIICISDHTKKELNTYCNVGAKPISVIHHGIDVKPSGLSARKPLLTEKYFLYIGPRKFYKNFNLLLDTFIKLIKEYNSCQLVVIGGEPLSKEEQNIFHKHSQNLKHIPYVSDESLKNLYEGAESLIITSLEEGFCYPAIEALLAGTDVICSNIAVLKEVIGENAFYFDVNDPESLLNTIVLKIENKVSKAAVLEKKFSDYYRLGRMCNETREFYNAFK